MQTKSLKRQKRKDWQNLSHVQKEPTRLGSRQSVCGLHQKACVTRRFWAITPNAPANAVLGETDGVIRLKLQAPAVEGKANAALVAFLAETLQVPKAAVSLKGGRRSRLKQAEVQGLDGAEACRRLLAPAG